MPEKKQDETAMSLDDFAALIAAYGAKPAHWPDDKRAAMQHLADNAPQAAALLAREAHLDDWLDARLPSPPDALQNNIIAAMDAELPQGNQATDSDSAWLQTARPSRRAYGAALMALAACFAFGFVATPTAVDALTPENELFAALDIISATFLPSEPL
ncbi:MAG: hypothetical protein ACON4V_02285 [Parvibaculales bacterium]